MSEMILRVASAMREWRGDPHLSPELTSFELGQATAAIKAMREPTEAMVSAAEGEALWDEDTAIWRDASPARAWLAMVDEALR